MAKNDVTGLSEWSQWANSLGGDLERAVGRDFETFAGRVENRAKANAPVDTGELRASIQHDVSGANGTIEATAEHAPYVEFGTSRQRAQPFFYPAVDREMANLERDINRTLDEVFR